MQVIDDAAAITLVAASTLTADIRQSLNGSGGGNKVCHRFRKQGRTSAVSSLYAANL